MAKKRRSLGLGFTDEVAKVTFTGSKFKKGVEDNWKDILLPHFTGLQESRPENFWLPTLFYITTLGLFFMVFLRLFHLQIVSGKSNRELADGNRIQIKVIRATRGVIFDRNGKVLAANQPAFRLLDKKNRTSRIISREEALELEVSKSSQIDLEVINVRTYPMGEKTAHLIGFVGEISETELKKEEFKTYRLGDFIGQSGIEAQYEKVLKGADGGEIIEVDSRGKRIRQLRVNPPTAGHNVYLNIDSDLQQKIYEQIKDTLKRVGSCCAAAVAMDPHSGQVLALLSFPGFDPNIFTKNRDEMAISEILAGPDHPVLNRVIGGSYPPGSTFKIVSSLAALESLKITPQTTFIDNGVLYLGIFKFTNWYYNQYGKTEGPVDLVKALKRSNDTYFYEAGKIIGIEGLSKWAQKLNAGRRLGIDLPGEISGLVPDDDWKRKTFGEVWYPGDTLHMAIGQGFVLTTPLQVLGFTSTVASNGILYKPRLINKVVAGSKTVAEFKGQVLISKIAKPQNINVIKEGLMQVVKEGGTAWPFFTFPIPTAGKTGTAEFGDPKGKTHAWYTSFAPADDPRIALTVLIEGGGEGSSIAAPIAKEAYRWYFSPDKNNLLKDIYPVATDSAKQLGE